VLGLLVQLPSTNLQLQVVLALQTVLEDAVVRQIEVSHEGFHLAKETWSGLVISLPSTEQWNLCLDTDWMVEGDRKVLDQEQVLLLEATGTIQHPGEEAVGCTVWAEAG